MSKKIILLRLFLLIQTCIFLTQGIFQLAVMIRVHDAISFGGLLSWDFPQFTVLQYYPTITIPPLILLCIAIIYFYLFLKTKRDRSRKIYYFTVLSIFTLPIVSFTLYVINNYKYDADAGLSAFKNNSLFELVTLWITTYITSTILMILALAILLYLLKKEFNGKSAPIGKIQKRMLIPFASIILIPVLLAYTYAYFRAYTDNNLGHEKTAKHFSFKLLKPTYLPEGYAQINAYHLLPEEKTGTKTSQVVFDLEYFYTMYHHRSYDQQPTGFIVVIQSNNYYQDIAEYQSNLPERVTLRKEIKIPQAKMQKGLYIQRKTDKDLLVKEIFFITKDNSLVKVQTLSIDDEYFIRFAQGLK